MKESLAVNNNNSKKNNKQRIDIPIYIIGKEDVLPNI
jgi:hypothetical protein